MGNGTFEFPKSSFEQKFTTYIPGLSSLGVPGVPWHTQILADQLTLFQPGGTDCAHLITTGTPGFSDLLTALPYISINSDDIPTKKNAFCCLLFPSYYTAYYYSIVYHQHLYCTFDERNLTKKIFDDFFFKKLSKIRIR